MREPRTANQPASAGTTRSARPAFFATGGPLAPDRPGYVERAADTAIRDAIESQEFVNLTGAPKSGKTSLLLRLAHRLRDSEEPPLVAFIELRQLLEREGRDDVARCFYAIAFRLARQLRVGFDLQNWWADNSMLAYHLRFAELFREFALAHPGRRIVLMFDDTGDLIRRETGEPLLVAFRQVFDARATDAGMGQLSIVFGSTGDAQFGLQESARLPYAVATRVSLEPFSFGQTLKLAPALGFSRDVAELAMQRIFDWVAGQPAMTQQLAEQLARRREDPQDVVAAVDALVEKVLCPPDEKQQAAYLTAVAARVLGAPKVHREQMLIVLGRASKQGRMMFDPKSPAHDRLLAVGAVRVNPEGELIPGSRIVRRRLGAAWANRHLPLRFAGVAAVLAFLLATLLVPWWYGNVLPRHAVATMTDPAAPLPDVVASFEDLSGWPGHGVAARRMIGVALAQRFDAARTVGEVDALRAAAVDRVPVQQLDDWESRFWRRQRDAAYAGGRRGVAMAAVLRALELQPEDAALRRELAALIGTDLSALRAVIPTGPGVSAVRYRPRDGALITRHAQRLQVWQAGDGRRWQRRGAALEPTALQPAPVNMRFDLPALARPARLQMALVVEHPRPADVWLTLTSPTGVSAQVRLDRLPGPEWTLANVPELAALRRASPAGIWSLTLFDARPGLTGEVRAASANGRGADVTGPLPLPDPTPSPASRVALDPVARFALALPAEPGHLVTTWDLVRGQQVAALPTPADSELVGFATGGNEAVLLAGGHLLSVAQSDGTARRIGDAKEVYGRAWIAASGAFLVAEQQGSGVFDVIATATGDLAGRIETGAGARAVAVADDGRAVAVADADRVVRVWDPASPRQPAQMPVDADVERLQFAGDQLLVHGAQGGMWSGSPDRLDSTVRWPGGAHWTVAYDAQFGLALLGSERDGFRVHDLAARADRSLPLLGIDGEPVIAQQLRLREGLAVMAAPGSGLVTLWSPELAALPVGSARVRRAWLSRDGRSMAFTDARDSFNVVRLDAGIAELLALDDDVVGVAHSEPPQHVVFSPGGELAISFERSGLYRLHDLDAASLRGEIGRIPGPVTAAAFSMDGRRLRVATASRLHLIDTVSGRAQGAPLPTEAVSALAFDVVGGGWFVGEQSGRVAVLGDSPGAPVRALLPANGVPVAAIAGGLRHQRVAVARGRELLVLTVGAELEISAPLEFPTGIDALVASPDGRYLVVRAGQWLHRVRVGGRESWVTDRRLVPAGALRHAGIAPVSRDARRVRLLDGLDEPAPRTLGFDASEVAPVSASPEALMSRWQPLLTVVAPFLE